MAIETAVVVCAETRLEQLQARFNTRAQTRFYLEQNGQDFAAYQAEHDTYHHSLEAVLKALARVLKVKPLERQYVARNLFADTEVVVVVGRDGLVANTAKYVGGRPLAGVNPDPSRNVGVLLPFGPDTLLAGLRPVLEGKAYPHRTVTLAEARLQDGQRLLAFNDLFVGAETHVSARYGLQYAGAHEDQSSSGLIVSTGAGSTGWLSSVFNMAWGVQQAFFGTETAPKAPSKAASSKTKKAPAAPAPPPRVALPWDTEELIFVVREPYQSQSSGIALSAGRIGRGTPLVLESHMPVGGRIFSDGIEADYLSFTSGTVATIGIADEVARLISPAETPGVKG
ncbi:MAG: hypothetical protein SFY70_01710 [Bacteroidia bacterium]|nr:hypothetical protein [Bacteroidia bacterium]